MQNAGKVLGHIILPMVTPFHDGAQDVNYDMAQTLADKLVATKSCDSIAVTGTTGEFYVLDYSERVELYKQVKEAVNGRVPLVAGTGAASTREAIALTKEAERLGYDYAMVVAPYYCKPCQEGIYEHYRAIAESVEMPIMLYNIPIFTGVNVDVETVARLAQIPNIVAIKDESGINPVQMTRYMRAVRKDFTVYNGDDIMVLCGLSQGAAGVISGGAHIASGKMREMITSFLAGDLANAQRLHHELDKLFEAFCPNGRIIPTPLLKAAIELTGLKVGNARAPLHPATKAELDNIKKVMTELAII